MKDEKWQADGEIERAEHFGSIENDDPMENIENIIQVMHSLTKLDIRFVTPEGEEKFPIIHHTIPSILHPPNLETPLVYEILQQHGPGHYYHHTNPYGLEYLAAGFWRGKSLDGYILIGPFISSHLIVELIQKLIMNKQIQVGERRALQQFYESLTILSTLDCQHLGQLLVHLCDHPFMDAHEILTETERSAPSVPIMQNTIDEQRQLIEQRYEHQNGLMDAISAGDYDKLAYHVNYLIAELVAFSDRVPGSPIRSSKNIGFVLNTMCRIAAERGGVHPVYLHNISERYAIMIERAKTFPQLKQLYISMAEEYCELVVSVATRQYSPIVKKAIEYIYLNLGSSLLLKSIAEHVHVNPSHLSRKFKEETGMTITDFINKKRVDEARLHLRRGNLSVTEVAFLVGFNDLNYFGKVFKKFTNETPSQYAKRRK